MHKPVPGNDVRRVGLGDPPRRGLLPGTRGENSQLRCGLGSASAQSVLRQVPWLKKRAEEYLAKVPVSLPVMVKAKEYGAEAVYSRCADSYGATLFTLPADESGWLYFCAAGAGWKVGRGREIYRTVVRTILG